MCLNERVPFRAWYLDDGQAPACSKTGKRFAADIDDFEAVIPLRMPLDEAPVKCLDAGEISLRDIARDDGEQVYVTDACVEAAEN